MSKPNKKETFIQDNQYSITGNYKHDNNNPDVYGDTPQPLDNRTDLSQCPPCDCKFDKL